jgi:hypothetical protein
VGHRRDEPAAAAASASERTGTAAIVHRARR